MGSALKWLPSGASYLFALAAQMSGWTSPTVAALLAFFATVMLLIPAWYHFKEWHKRRNADGKLGVEPTHLIVFGIGGVTIFALIAATGLIWQRFSPPQAPSATRISIAAPALKQVPAPILTSESLATRQKALTQLSDFIDDKIEDLLHAGKDLVESTGHKNPATLLNQAKEFREQIINSYKAQSRILTRYNGINDIFEIANWNYFAVDMEPAINEYISTLELLVNNSVTNNDGSISRHPSFYRFSICMEKLPDWMNEARRNIGKKRAEYDKTKVYE